MLNIWSVLLFHFSFVAFQLVPKLTRNFMKEGFMEKTGPKVCFVTNSRQRSPGELRQILKFHRNGPFLNYKRCFHFLTHVTYRSVATVAVQRLSHSFPVFDVDLCWRSTQRASRRGGSLWTTDDWCILKTPWYNPTLSTFGTFADCGDCFLWLGLSALAVSLQDAYARGEVFIGSKENSYTVLPGLPSTIQGYHWNHGITIVTPDRKFLFACETEAEQRDWIAAFQRVMNRPMRPQEYAGTEARPTLFKIIRFFFCVYQLHFNLWHV